MQTRCMDCALYPCSTQGSRCAATLGCGIQPLRVNAIGPGMFHPAARLTGRRAEFAVSREPAPAAERAARLRLELQELEAAAPVLGPEVSKEQSVAPGPASLGRLVFTLLEQLDERGLAAIAETAFVPFDDPGIAARAVLVTRPQLAEEPADRRLVVQPGDGQTPGVQGALLGQGDQLLDERPQLLGLFDRGDDPPMLDQRPRQVAHEGMTVLGIPTQFSSGFQMSHGTSRG